MATAHNRANVGDIAKVVLMPGDPLRAKYIAEMYLTDVIQFNDIRNMLGYTGMYKGKRFSVMGSGMGCGSIGIYSHELYNKYDVEIILRVGSCGAYTNEVKLLDTIVVSSSYSASSYAKTYSEDQNEIMYGDETFRNHMLDIALKLQIDVTCKRIHTSDCFYHKKPEDLRYLVDDMHCVGVDMESFALFHNAHMANKIAGCLLTVSDHMITKEKVSADHRENSFHHMVQIALESLLPYA